MEEALLLRAAAPEDAAALLAIYAPYVTDTAITFEYDVPSEAEFAERDPPHASKDTFPVAERGGVRRRRVGAFKERAAYAWGKERAAANGRRRQLYAALRRSSDAERPETPNACIRCPRSRTGT